MSHNLYVFHDIISLKVHLEDRENAEKVLEKCIIFPEGEISTVSISATLISIFYTLGEGGG